jgi:hypothetical protein
MTATGPDPQAVSPLQQTGAFLIGKSKAGAALQQADPLLLLLLIPESWSTAGPTGMNALQPHRICGEKHLGVLLSRGWGLTPQQ